MRFEAAEALFSGASLPPRKTFFAWAKALYLHERAALLPEAPGPRLAAPSPRLRRFLTQAPFDEAAMLRARLAEDGLDRDKLELLLSLPAAELAGDTEVPAWAEKLLELYGEERPAIGADPVATLISPLIDAAKTVLWRELSSLFAVQGPALGAELDRLVPSLLVPLDDLLSREARRSVVLELHACRQLGLLAGETGEERLHDYCRRLSTPFGAFELFDAFPLLGRRLVELQERFLEGVLEMMGRLVGDLPLWPQLLPAGVGRYRLVAVQGGLSDPHRGGRSVWILVFEDGQRLVYKPKRLAAELSFARLLDWLAGHTFAITLRALRVLDRGEYGWAEWVQRQDAANAAEVREFYRRQGAFLALLHALQAVDFHHENLIAAGAFPVLIDLECLFHPQVDAVAAAGAVGSSSIDAYLDTVHAIGFLPQQIWDEKGAGGLDISGLGAAAGRHSPQAIPRLIERGTDEMRIGNEVISLPDPHSTPRLEGAEVRLEDYREDLLGGFTETYRFLIRHRRELLAPGGPIEAFAGVEQRVLLRATTSYITLLGGAGHPQVLGDALDADLLFDRLWSVLAARPFLRPVLRDEREALLRGDVPLFTVWPGRRDLKACSGRCHPDFFAETGIARVRRRWFGFGEEDLAKQSRIIAGTLESVALSRQPRFWQQHRLHEKEGQKPSTAALLAAAEKIAAHLEKLEVRREESSFFFAQRPTGNGAFTYDPVNFDLYRGQAGIALFYAQLFVATGENRWARAARRVAEPVLATFEVSPLILPNIGAFGGWAGIGYALERMAVLLGEPCLASLAAEVPGKIASLLDQDRQFDVLGGAAGSLLYLLRRARRYREPGALELATRAGDHLLAHSSEEQAGRLWVASGQGAGLAGLSHGSGGIAWALFELAAATGEKRFAAAAREALRHERSLFRPAAGNWVDLRTSATESARPDHDENFLCAWCHGAVGIGMARLQMLQLLQGAEKAEAEAEIGVAAATALRDGFGSSHCLCHGDLGTLDFLLEVAQARGDSALRRRIEGLAAGLLVSLEDDGWRCGLSHGVEQPGLFLGLAGIGYGLLRLADPAGVPSVLALAGP